MKEYKIVCYHCSKENTYHIKNPEQLPIRPKLECKKCKKQVYLKFSFDTGQIIVEPVKKPKLNIEKNDLGNSVVLSKTKIPDKKKDLKIDNYRKELTAFKDLELIRHSARETLIDGIIMKDSNLIRIGLQALISYNDKSGSIKESNKRDQPSLKEMLMGIPESKPFELSEIDKHLLRVKEKAILDITEQLEEG